MSRILLVFAAIVLLLIGLTTLARATIHPIDGISCDSGADGYHIHAFLSIVNRGQVAHPPAGVGIHYEHLCLYWLHTHDASGIIHIEAPRRLKPVLGQFFAVWGEPLTRRRVAGLTVGPGQHLKVYVGLQPYSGDPRAIPLRNHTSITIEVGPPFEPPIEGNFAGV